MGVAKSQTGQSNEAHSTWTVVLQGISPTQGLDPVLLLAGRFFTG